MPLRSFSRPLNSLENLMARRCESCKLSISLKNYPYILLSARRRLKRVTTFYFLLPALMPLFSPKMPLWNPSIPSGDAAGLSAFLPYEFLPKNGTPFSIDSHTCYRNARGRRLLHASPPDAYGDIIADGMTTAYVL